MVIRRQKPKRTRLPRGQGKPRNHRVREKRVARKLCDWLKRGRNDRLTPSFNEALAGKYISHFVE